jgi:hypothetical protein
MKEYDNIALGNINETKSVMYSSLEIFKLKLDETVSTCQTAIEGMTAAF